MPGDEACPCRPLGCGRADRRWSYQASQTPLAARQVGVLEMTRVELDDESAAARAPGAGDDVLLAGPARLTQPRRGTRAP
jgi:hypothetical protein